MKSSRTTVAKTEIQKLLSDSPSAMSHIEIQNALDGMCDRVTIYRVLNRLIIEKIIHKIGTIDGVVKYAACQNTCSHHHNHTHIHFNCEICKTVTCLNEVEVNFSLPTEYKINEVNFTVSGVCEKCQ
jgi:Fur family transcriptional regulator, ferric uptake regulator